MTAVRVGWTTRFPRRPGRHRATAGTSRARTENAPGHAITALLAAAEFLGRAFDTHRQALHDQEAGLIRLDQWT